MINSIEDLDTLIRGTTLSDTRKVKGSLVNANQLIYYKY